MGLFDFNVNSIRLRNLVKDVVGDYRANMDEVSSVNGNSFDNSSSNYSSNANVETMDLSLPEDSSIDSNLSSTDVNINPTSSSNVSNINNIGSSSDSLNNSQSSMSNFSPSNNLSSTNNPAGYSSPTTGSSSGVNSTNAAGGTSNLSSSNFGSDSLLSNTNSSTSQSSSNIGSSNLSGNIGSNASGTYGNNTPLGSNVSSGGIDIGSLATPVGDRADVDTASLSVDRDVNVTSGNSIDHSFDRIENMNLEVSSLEQIRNSINVVDCIYQDILQELRSYSTILDLLNEQTEHGEVNINGRTSFSLLEQYVDARARNLDSFDQIRSIVDGIVSNNSNFSNYDEFIEYYNQLELYSEQLNASLYNLHAMEREQPYLDLRNTDEYRNFQVPESNLNINITEEVTTISTGDIITRRAHYTEGIDPIQFILQTDRYDNLIIDGLSNEVELRNLIRAGEENPDLLRTFEYLYHTEGMESAYQYLEAMEDRINQIVGQMNAEEFLNGLDNIDSNTIGAYINNHIIVHGRGLSDGLANCFSGLMAWFNGDSPYSVSDYESMYIMQALQENEDLYGRFLAGNYQLGQGVGNMIPSAVISIFLSRGAGMALLGASAGGNSYRNSRLEGYSELQSIIYGLMSGASEAIFEQYFGGLPGLSEVNVSSIGDLLTSMAQEGLEEVYQDGMDYITRGVIFHDWPDEITADDIREFIGNEIRTWYMGALTAGEMDLGAAAIGAATRPNDNIVRPSQSTVDNSNNGPIVGDLAFEGGRSIFDLFRRSSATTTNNIDGNSRWSCEITNSQFRRVIDGNTLVSSSESGLQTLINYYNNMRNAFNNVNSRYYIDNLNGRGLYLTNIPRDNNTRVSFNSGNVVYINPTDLANNYFNIFFHETGHFFDIFVNRNSFQNQGIDLINRIRNNTDIASIENSISRFNADYLRIGNGIVDSITNNSIIDYVRSVTNSFDTLSVEAQQQILRDYRIRMAENAMNARGYAAVSDIIHALFNEATQSAESLFFKHDTGYYRNISLVYAEVIANISDLYNTNNLGLLRQYLPQSYVDSLVRLYENIINVEANNRQLSNLMNIQDGAHGTNNFITSILAYLTPGSDYYHNPSVFTSNMGVRDAINSMHDSQLQMFLTSSNMANSVLSFIQGILGTDSFRASAESLLQTGNSTSFTRQNNIRFFIETLMQTENWRGILSSFLIENYGIDNSTTRLDEATPTTRLDDVTPTTRLDDITPNNVDTNMEIDQPGEETNISEIVEESSVDTSNLEVPQNDISIDINTDYFDNNSNLRGPAIEFVNEVMSSFFGDSFTSLLRASVSEFRDLLNNSYVRYILSLPIDQFNALRNYSGETYHDINDYLRNGSSFANVDYIEGLIDEIDGAMQRYGGLPEAATLFRNIDLGHLSSETSLGRLLQGVDINDAEMVLSRLQSLVGETIVDPGYLSTSFTENGTLEGNVEFILQTPAGAVGVDVSTISANYTENEFILGRDTILHIESVTSYVGEDGQVHYRIEAVVESADIGDIPQTNDPTVLDSVLQQFEESRQVLYRRVQNAYQEAIQTGDIPSNMTFEEFLTHDDYSRSIGEYKDLIDRIGILESMRQ